MPWILDLRNGPQCLLADYGLAERIGHGQDVALDLGARRSMPNLVSRDPSRKGTQFAFPERPLWSERDPYRLIAVANAARTFSAVQGDVPDPEPDLGLGPPSRPAREHSGRTKRPTAASNRRVGAMCLSGIREDVDFSVACCEEEV